MALDVTKLFVSLQIFEKASNVSALKKWLKKTHGLEISSEIFTGYKYFLESSYHLIFSAFEYDYAFGLTESELFHRAGFDGKRLGDFSPDCDKTIFLLNLNNRALSFLRANKVDDLEKEVNRFRQDTLGVFENILSKAYFKKSPLNDNEFARCLIIGNVYLYFHQYGNSKSPYAYHTNLLGHRISDEKLKRTLKGYKYSLQFLWYQLLQSNEIANSIKRIHQAKGWTEYDNFDKKETRTKIRFVSEEDSYNPLLEDRRVDLRKRKDLDSYFWRVQRDVIRPISNKIGHDIVDLSDKVFLRKPPHRKLFDIFLKMPEYNKKRDLGEIMLWYSAEYIHSRKSSMHLGVPAFNTLLAGAVELKNHHKTEGKIRILRFVHTHESDGEKDKNDYTYGVLINSYHNDNNYDRGWLLFFNSCADYSGFSGSEHRQAEDLIAHYLKKDKIQVETVKISLQELGKFLGEQSIIYRNEKELTSKVHALEGKDKESIGFLFELFCSYYSSKTRQDVKIIWSSGDGEDDEVDVVINGENEITVVECKLNPNSIDLEKEIEKLRKKIKTISAESAQVKELFLFWKEPNAKQKQILADRGTDYEYLSLIARSKVHVNKHVERLFAIFDGETMSLLDMLDLEVVE